MWIITNEIHCIRSGVWLSPATKIVQGWPKFWPSFRARKGIFGQSVGPSVAIWASLTPFSRTGGVGVVGDPLEVGSVDLPAWPRAEQGLRLSLVHPLFHTEFDRH
jgi:hypothetical protein